VLGASGLAGTGVALAVGVMVPVAIIPVAICGALAVGVARRQRQRAAETSVALEQVLDRLVLDRLEHGELDLHRAAGSARTSPLVRVADEIRRTLSPRGAPVITNPNSR